MTDRPPVGMAVTTARPHARHARLGTSALASLIPWAGFLAAVEVADLSVENKSTSLGGLIASAPVYLAFVALPSLLPLAVARRGLVWISVVIVMSAVAVAAGILVMTTDDAQAGLAVLWVAFVAVPLAGVLWIGEAVAARGAAPARPRDTGSISPAPKS
jgi:hypothetical protein